MLPDKPVKAGFYGCFQFLVHQTVVDGFIYALRYSLSADSEQHVIAGGNHAQFGNYGKQMGDGDAFISVENQQRQTVKMILWVNMWVNVCRVWNNSMKENIDIRKCIESDIAGTGRFYDSVVL